MVIYNNTCVVGCSSKWDIYRRKPENIFLKGYLSLPKLKTGFAKAMN